MKRIITVTLFFGMVTTMSIAGMKPGTVGLGWYSASAPVGGRLWVTEQVALDLGLGYADKNTLGGTQDRFHVNVGLPFNVVETEHVNFFIRPGVEIQTNSRTVGTELKSTLFVTADLGAEWLVTDQFSLSVGHGLTFQQIGGTEDNWGVSALRALSIDQVGFHFYFK